MYREDDLIPISALQHLAFCARQCALIHVEQVWAENRLTAVALGAVVGGAIGNVIDRVRFGAVVDFVDASAWDWHWYVFNVADAAIVCGVLALVADALFRPKPGPNEGP